MARPTKLTKQLVADAKAYVRETEEVDVDTLLPTVEGLALRLGISRETVYAWSSGAFEMPEKPTAADEALARLHAQFSDIVARLKAAQGEKLIQKSLSGAYNATIAKLILSGKHDYVERQATELSGANGAPVGAIVEIIESGKPQGETEHSKD